MPKCQAQTKQGNPCPNHTEYAEEDGTFHCHIHHSRMVFRLQLEAKRLERSGKGKPLPKKARDYAAQVEALRQRVGASTPNRRV